MGNFAVSRRLEENEPRGFVAVLGLDKGHRKKIRDFDGRVLHQFPQHSVSLGPIDKVVFVLGPPDKKWKKEPVLKERRFELFVIFPGECFEVPLKRRQSGKWEELGPAASDLNFFHGRDAPKGPPGPGESLAGLGYCVLQNGMRALVVESSQYPRLFYAKGGDFTRILIGQNWTIPRHCAANSHSMIFDEKLE